MQQCRAQVVQSQRFTTLFAVLDDIKNISRSRIVGAILGFVIIESGIRGELTLLVPTICGLISASIIEMGIKRNTNSSTYIAAGLSGVLYLIGFFEFGLNFASVISSVFFAVLGPWFSIFIKDCKILFRSLFER
jgi:hypothetical protein